MSFAVVSLSNNMKEWIGRVPRSCKDRDVTQECFGYIRQLAASKASMVSTLLCIYQSLWLRPLDTYQLTGLKVDA